MPARDTADLDPDSISAPSRKRTRRPRAIPAAAPSSLATLPALARESEAGFMRAVIQLAKLNHWLCWHDHDSRRNAPGLPDLILTRWPRPDSDARLIFAELKSQRGSLRADQRYWLETLRHVPGVEVYVWRPAQWSEIERTLL